MTFVAFAKQPDTTNFVDNQGKPRVYFFNSTTCVHCANEKVLLKELTEKNLVDVKSYEISNPANREIWYKVASYFNIQAESVPFTVMADEYRVGFSKGGEVEDWLRNKAEELNQPNAVYSDKVGELLGFENLENSQNIAKTETGQENQLSEEGATTINKIDEAKKIPITILGKNFGEFDATSLALPTAVFFIALIDGFNPCAMWILIFLISMLIDTKSRFRLFVLAGTFLFISGLVYFFILIGWAKFFQFLSPYVVGINLAIAFISLFFGYVALKDYLSKKEDQCEVIDANIRQNVFERIKKYIKQDSLILATVGIAFLAFAVNIVELFCSIGLPMIYAALLTNSGVGGFEALMYHLFYAFVFMLDDLVVFTIAILTLNISGITAKFSKPVKLITGVVMTIIAIYLYSEVLKIWFN